MSAPCSLAHSLRAGRRGRCEEGRGRGAVQSQWRAYLRRSGRRGRRAGRRVAASPARPAGAQPTPAHRLTAWLPAALCGGSRRARTCAALRRRSSLEVVTLIITLNLSACAGCSGARGPPGAQPERAHLAGLQRQGHPRVCRRGPPSPARRKAERGSGQAGGAPGHGPQVCVSACTAAVLPSVAQRVAAELRDVWHLWWRLRACLCPHHKCLPSRQSHCWRVRARPAAARVARPAMQHLACAARRAPADWQRCARTTLWQRAATAGRAAVTVSDEGQAHAEVAVAAAAA